MSFGAMLILHMQAFRAVCGSGSAAQGGSGGAREGPGRTAKIGMEQLPYDERLGMLTLQLGEEKAQRDTWPRLTKPPKAVGTVNADLLFTKWCSIRRGLTMKLVADQI